MKKISQNMNQKGRSNCLIFPKSWERDHKSAQLKFIHDLIPRKPYAAPVSEFSKCQTLNVCNQGAAEKRELPKQPQKHVF